MPAYRTRDTHSRSLEVTVDHVHTPMFNIVSPTPRAFTFPNIMTSPLSSPSNSPFEAELKPPTLTPPPTIPTPSSHISSDPSLQPAEPTQAPPAPTKTHRRRRSTASDINERRPKKGDEDYVKRPENAFILFRRKCCEDRNSALGAGEAGEGGDKASTPTKKQRQADLSKAISREWKALTAEERQYWEELAKEKKKEHEQLHPNYVYRPQRVKGKKAATLKGKGKKPDDEEMDDGEISFIMPLSVRPGRRAASAPTPPYQQHITVPPVFMSSTPASPSMVPTGARRPSFPFPAQNGGFNFDFAPSDGLQQPYPEPQGWDPNVNGSAGFVGTFDPTPFFVDNNNKNDVSLDSFGGCPDQRMFAPSQQLLVSSYAAGSSGPPSPDDRPFTPTSSLEVIGISGDIWQQHEAICMTDVPTSQCPPEMLEFEYRPFAWPSATIKGWTNGSQPLFNEDFDLSSLSPIELEGVKYSDDPKAATVESMGPGFPHEQYCSPAHMDVDRLGHDPFTAMFGYHDLQMSGEHFS